MDTATLRKNLEQVQERIAGAASRVGRSPEEITLVAVTKRHPPELVQAAYELGLRDIGENRVYEALEKQEALSDLADLRWHMVGHIQRRKARDAVGRFRLIHSLDSVRLARELHKRAKQRDVARVDVLLQVNVSGEESKYGFAARSAAEQEIFCRDVGEIVERFPRLRLQGLMTMAPFVDDPETIRPVFVGLRRLRDRVRRAVPHVEWRHLSMGMTNDFEVAVEEGATIVRIGTAIFGELR